MYRFFADKDQINGSRIALTGKDAHHIKDVLRLGIGDEIYVCTDDEWEYTCVISNISRDEVSVSVVDASRPGKELPARITLYQCLPKREKMELIIQKAVELGAVRIVPVMSARCIVKFDEKKKESRVERWNSIAEAAAKQSKRMLIPEVGQVMNFAAAVKEAKQNDVCMIPYEKSEGMDVTRSLMTGIRPGQSVAVFIGPEGGFEEQEVKLACDEGFQAVSLGKRILRTETAGMFVLSVLGFLLDDRSK